MEELSRLSLLSDIYKNSVKLSKNLMTERINLKEDKFILSEKYYKKGVSDYSNQDDWVELCYKLEKNKSNRVFLIDIIKENKCKIKSYRNKLSFKY